MELSTLKAYDDDSNDHGAKAPLTGRFGDLGTGDFPVAAPGKNE